MMVLITYDISLIDTQGQGRLRKVAKVCQDYGVRVQNSVFECDVEPAQWAKLKDKLLKEFNPNKDSLRFYMLGSNWRKRIEHYGAKPSLDMFKDDLIVD